MGLGKLFRGLLGGAGAASTGLEEMDEAILDALWRESGALSPGLVARLRDEYLRRRRRLPLAMHRTPFPAGQIQLDEILELESVVEYLHAVDLRLYASRTGSSRHLVGPTWVLARCNDTGHVLFLFPAWNGAASELLAPPADLASGVAVEAIVVMNEQAAGGGRGEAPLLQGYLATTEVVRALGVPPTAVYALDGAVPVDALPAGSRPEPEPIEPLLLPDELVIGEIVITRFEGALLVWEAETETETEAVTETETDDGPENNAWAVLVGAGVPPVHLRDESAPTDILGGIRWPLSDEELETLTADGWELDELMGISGITVLTDVAGTPGPEASRLVAGLRLVERAAGSGLAVPPGAQPILDAVLRGDPGAVGGAAPYSMEGAGAALGASEPGVASAVLRYLVIVDRPDLVAALLDAAGESEAIPAGLAGFYRGYLAELEGDLEGAEVHLRDADEPHALCQLAWLAARRGELEEARELADQAAPELPGDPVAAANRALLYWLTGDREQAMLDFQQALPGHISWARILVEELIDEGDPEQDSFGIWSPAGAWMAPFDEAMLLARGGDEVGAEKLLMRCLELEPRHPGAILELVSLLERVGRRDDAMAVRAEAERRLPRFAHLSLLAANLLAEAGDLDAAGAAYRTALDAFPEQIDWRLNLFLTFLEAGKTEVLGPEIDEIEEAGADMKLVSDLRKLAR